MLSYEPEIEAAPLAPETAGRLLAVQRREIFSLFPEIRALAWIGAMLIASGVGVLLSKHIKEIGPLTIAIVLIVAAGACYAWAWLRRDRVAVIDDSILLLGGLLVSADAGWVESQWHVFGAGALAILAIIHAVGSYGYKSRTLLSLSIGALAGWLGIERNIESIFSENIDLAMRMFTCAAIVAAWREADRRLRKQTTFTSVFDYTALLLAFSGALILTANNETTSIGLLITFVIAAGATFYAFLENAEPFLLLSVIFATLACDIWVWSSLHGDTLRPLITLVSAVAAVFALTVVHRRFRSRTA